MKLAEALMLRADIQKRIDQLKQRLLRNVKVQEGDRPAENPEALLSELERLLSELRQLIQRINKTNSGIRIEGTTTLTDALAERDTLALRLEILREVVKAASVTQERYTKSEVRFRSMVNVAELQQQIDDLARQHRELDTRIQALNWQTELAE